jgi:hypothetical protein
MHGLIHTDYIIYLCINTNKSNYLIYNGIHVASVPNSEQVAICHYQNCFFILKFPQLFQQIAVKYLLISLIFILAYHIEGKSQIKIHLTILIDISK